METNQIEPAIFSMLFGFLICLCYAFVTTEIGVLCVPTSALDWQIVTAVNLINYMKVMKARAWLGRP